ncbi:MAG: efflux RND transporter permease subunit [Gammaproteobacteria bacterium]|nr:efflux RND transporter permease subunit [Gammaproteobacteria bacterium]
MSLAQRCIQRPIATALATVGILLSAWLGCRLLPVAALPQVDFPTIEVTALLPGASAETIAATVAAPLEQEFQRIPSLAEMSSTSTVGITTITLQFGLQRNIDSAAQDVQKAINAASALLPKDMPSPPTYDKVNPAELKVLTIALTSDSVPLNVVDEYATTFMIRPLSELAGIGLVDRNGAQKPAIRVEVNPVKLASMGLTLEDVRGALASATVNSPKGTLENAYREETLDSSDQLLDARAADEQIIGYRGGAPVRVRDIGHAASSVENVQSAGWYQRRRAILVDVHLQPGANLVDVVNEVRGLLPSLEAHLPRAIEAHVLGDRSHTVRATVTDMKLTLGVTMALVVMVMFLFLRRIWATLIPSFTIPVSLVCAGGVMYLLGYSLDNLSFMALVIAVGFVVDDAIVMIENISRHVEAGEPILAAAARGAGEVTFTIISMTASLIAVFIPLLFMGGMTGRMFREFGMTVTVALIASAMVSLTLIPAMCSQLLRHEPAEGKSAFSRSAGAAFERLLDAYRRSLEWALARAPLMLGTFLALLLLTLGLFLVIPKGFIPDQDVGIIVGSTQFAADDSFEEVAHLQQEVADAVMTDPAVADVSSFIQTDHRTSGRMYIDLEPFGSRPEISAVIARLRSKVAGIMGVTLDMEAAQDVQIGTHLSSTEYQYTLEDANLTELYSWAPRLTARLAGLPQLRDVATDLKVNAPHIRIVIDRDLAGRLGITAQSVDETLYDAYGQRQVATLYTQLDQFHIVMEVDPGFRLDAAALDRLYVRAASGALVPLAAFSHLQHFVAPESVSHLSQFPAVTLSFNLAPGVSLGQAVAAVQAAARALGMPPSAHASLQGAAQAFETSLRSEPGLIAAAILAVYIVLGILYESLLHPLTILSTLPSAGVGALAALLLTGNELNLMSLVGIILLIGIVKKNAIMMIDFAIAEQRSSRCSAAQAIHRAALLRFRPIVMTTMTALLGSLPLALGTGAGSELRRPLGIAVAGGLLVSQLLTLYTTPVVFICMERLRAASTAGATATRPSLP